MPGWWASRSAQNSPASCWASGSRLRVVERGLAFLQVVDEQVADRAAGELVAVDQLARGCAARRVRSWGSEAGGAPAEDAGLAQQPVEHGAVRGALPRARARRRGAPGGRRR